MRIAIPLKKTHGFGPLRLGKTQNLLAVLAVLAVQVAQAIWRHRRFSGGGGLTVVVFGGANSLGERDTSL